MTRRPAEAGGADQLAVQRKNSTTASKVAYEAQSPLVSAPTGATIVNHAAAELLELIAGDAAQALVSAAADAAVHDAVVNLLAVLVVARDRRRSP